MPLSEWLAIRGTIRNSYQHLLSALPNSAKDCLLCPTPTVSWATGRNRRPAGGNKLITWLKRNGLLENGLVLNAEIVELLQGFPLGWTQILESCPGRESTLEEGSCSVEASSQNRRRSLCAASFTSAVSHKETGDGRQENSFNVEFPLEPKEKQGDKGRSPSTENISSPVLGEKSRSHGWLEKYTKTKKLKNGVTVTYPIAQERDPDNPEHWYWAYRWEEKKSTAKSDNGFVTRAVSLPQNKVEAVRLAIALGWSIQKILSFIRGELQ